MGKTDASFTFLHRVEEIELNTADGRWQSALALALTLPDICGGIAFPDIVKHYRDGRVMHDRQKKPIRDVGAQYTKWFDEFASQFFKINAEDERPYICGERCWQLRCEYLHQNKGFQNDEEDASDLRFHLGVNCGSSVCQMRNGTVQDSDNDIRIDIEQFCLRMCQAARNYYELTHNEHDFSLYNTPVLDFVQSQNAEEFEGGDVPRMVSPSDKEREDSSIARMASPSDAESGNSPDDRDKQLREAAKSIMLLSNRAHEISNSRAMKGIQADIQREVELLLRLLGQDTPTALP